MKLLGDVPEKHKNLATKLEEYEKHLEGLKDFPKDRLAQSLVCLAHDWYQIGMEEECGRLLAKADKIFPGYFVQCLVKHTKESKDFDSIVKTLTVELTNLLLLSIVDKKNAK